VDCEGNDFSFKQLSGRVTIVINIADPTNQTPQSTNDLRELVQLYHEYQQRGVEVVAFPSGRRGGNEVTHVRSSIDSWRDKMGIRFHLMQATAVNGPAQHPVYSFLKQQGTEIKGPFHTAFVVVCVGDRCTIHRFDGKPPRALRSHLEQWLPDVSMDEAEVHVLNCP